MLLPAGPMLFAVAVSAADPVTQDGLQLWLAADQGVTETDGHVTAWTDVTGRGTATGEPGTLPTLAPQALNGHPAVRFDGGRSFLVYPYHEGLSPTGGLTVIAVYTYEDGFRLAQQKNLTGGLERDAWFVSPANGLGIAGTYAHARMFIPGQPVLQTSVYDPAAAELHFYVDGEAKRPLRDVPRPTANTDPLYLGKRNLPGGSQGHLKGALAELLIYSRPLSDAARERVEAYLRGKYRIAPRHQPEIALLRLIPGDHRYDVDWQPTKPLGQVYYELQTKYRSADWDHALTTTSIPAEGPAGQDGLFNHTDYTVRIVARSPLGKLVGSSAERLVTCGEVPGVVVDYLHKDDLVWADYGQYFGSPSIAKLDDGALVTSHDLFGLGSMDRTRVFRSEDRGLTWRHVAELDRAFWGKLFVHRGVLYLLSSSTQYGDLMLHCSRDAGHTWDQVVLSPGRYHKAPMPVIEHGGRLWTCVEQQTGGWPAGFRAVCCSVPSDADLLDPNAWTISEPLAYDPSWLPEGWTIPVDHQGFLEGNAVVAPDGHLVDILRYNVGPYDGKAVVLDIAPDGKSLSFNRVIDFDGGMTKFTIRREPGTGVYWSLANRITRPGAAGQRSVLTLVRSKDLDHWEPVRDILRDDREFAVRYTGFQYVDWLFDGRDIIVASRTAFNGAHNFHDANHLTFHRVGDYAAPSLQLGP